ncbi:hypothetical protein B0H21DRAFT_557622 [Amylocystis lapponica]|nr:hypothetical protein B0H21DRAFT_557622 [Amylocystis lapponica]
MESPTASPAIARRTVGAKLRNIFTPKPKLAPLAPAISFPTRLQTRRKRDHNEITRDENDAVSAASARAHVRQRVGSTTSIASIETIRPESVARPSPPRCRTSSMISVNDPAAASLARIAASRATQSLLVASDASPAAKTALAHTSSHNQSAVTPMESQEDNCPSQRDEPVALPPDGRAQQASATRSAPSVAGPLAFEKPRTLVRTRSYRNLPSHLGEACPTSHSAAEIVPVTPKEAERPAQEVEAELGSELPEILAPLSEDDEDVIRRVVASIVAGAAEGEASDIRGLLDRGDGPESPVTNVFSFLDHEEEDEAPGLPYSPSARDTSPECDAQLEQDRFGVYLNPRKRQTVLWDLAESDFYAWPGILYVTDAEPYPSPAPAPVPVQRLEIEWRTVNLDEVPGVPFDDDTELAQHHPDYVATLCGQTLRRSQVATRLDPRRGICTEPRWRYVAPEQTAHGMGAVWAIRFWVPVPMSLFVGRESRLFRLRARVGFGGWDIPWVLGHSEAVDVSIDHLQRERVMGSPAPRED